MGTLSDQRPRTETLETYFIQVGKALDYMEVKRDKATPAQYHAACDIVRTALAVQSADTLDEQLAGFGEIAQSLVSAVEGLKQE